MNLTDQEMVKISKIAFRHKSEITDVYPAGNGSEESYFRDRNSLKLFEYTIFEYSFDTPIQFIEELKKMWEYQNADYMLEFITVCTVAAFKYRNQSVNSDQTKGISPFVYEF